MPKNFDELMEEAGCLLAEGEQLHRKAFQHLADPEIQAAVDRYIVKWIYWPGPWKKSGLRISNPTEGLAGN